MEKNRKNNDLCPEEKLRLPTEDAEDIADFPTAYLLPFLYDDEEKEEEKEKK